MVGRSLSPAFTIDDARSYVNDVKEAFGADEPAKYREFLDIMQGLRANRIDYPTVVATVEELLKDHQDLLLRFNAFLPAEPKKTIPPEANKGLGQFQATVGRSEPPKLAFDDAVSYIDTVREAFHDEPAKYREFIEILNDYRRGVSKGRVCARVKRVLKGHRNLLRGFKVFVPAGSTITIASPKAEQRAASDNNKRIRVANFITKLKARFQGDDRHLYESFLEILTMYQEGNKSVNDLYQEVVALLQGHEDLVMEFADVFKKTTDPSGQNLLEIDE